MYKTAVNECIDLICQKSFWSASTKETYHSRTQATQEGRYQVIAKLGNLQHLFAQVPREPACLEATSHHKMTEYSRRSLVQIPPTQPTP